MSGSYKRHLTALALKLCLLCAMSAHAATEPEKTTAPPHAAIQQAKQLMQDGKPASAYKLLEPLEFDNAGNTDFDYLIGIAALDSGKADKATLAFERVLTRDPNLAGARLDMARAWYILGDFARARQELATLTSQNPPPAAQEMIKLLHTAINTSEKEAQRSQRWAGYVEAGFGFDDNVTSVVNDFSSAVLATYDLPGFEPTGSSVKRSSSTLFLQGGVDFSQRLAEGVSFEGNLDGRWRFLPRSQRYSSSQLDSRGALQYRRNLNQWKIGATLQNYWQETENPTANRHSYGLFGQWVHNRGENDQISLLLSANRQRYPDVPTNDGETYYLSTSWLHQYQGDSKAFLQTTLTANRDHSKYLLFNGAKNDKDSLSLRFFGQCTPRQDIDVFASFSYTKRVDQDAYAHSTLVAYGRDYISDLSVGMNWRAKPDWTLRTQWNYARNDSNIALNQYRRNEVSVALRYEFQ